jgi:hypothetical protein
VAREVEQEFDRIIQASPRFSSRPTRGRTGDPEVDRFIDEIMRASPPSAGLVPRWPDGDAEQVQDLDVMGLARRGRDMPRPEDPRRVQAADRPPSRSALAELELVSAGLEAVVDRYLAGEPFKSVFPDIKAHLREIERLQPNSVRNTPGDELLAILLQRGLITEQEANSRVIPEDWKVVGDMPEDPSTSPAVPPTFDDRDPASGVIDLDPNLGVATPDVVSIGTGYRSPLPPADVVKQPTSDFRVDLPEDTPQLFVDSAANWQGVFERAYGIPASGRNPFQAWLARQFINPMTEYDLLGRHVFGPEREPRGSFLDYLRGREGPLNVMQGDFLTALTSMSPAQQGEIFRNDLSYESNPLREMVFRGALQQRYAPWHAEAIASRAFAPAQIRAYAIDPLGGADPTGATPFLNYLRSQFDI